MHHSDREVGIPMVWNTAFRRLVRRVHAVLNAELAQQVDTLASEF